MSTDIPVQCCRCMNRHLESERDSKKSRNGMNISICPRCGEECYFDMRPLVAWCWASGLIGVGDEMPPDSADGGGAIKIALGPKSQLMHALRRFAIQGCGNEFFVPGVSDRKTQQEAGIALSIWLDSCSKQAKRSKVLGEVVFNLPVQWDAL